MTATINNQTYITDAKRHVKALWNAYENLKAMQDQWNALDYGNTLMNGSGINDGISAASVGACVFDTTNAISTLFASGHATNLAKLL